MTSLPGAHSLPLKCKNGPVEVICCWLGRNGPLGRADVSGWPLTVSAVPPTGARGPIGWAHNRTLVVLAVGYQWFYSGANFVVFKIGGGALNPLMLAAMRFTIAAALVLPLAAWRWRSRPARVAELASAAALGVVMLAGARHGRHPPAA